MSQTNSSRPFENLLPLLKLLTDNGNVAVDGGFVMNPDGWRCRVAHRVDFELIERSAIIPDGIDLAPDFDTVLDKTTWCSIEGPGAHPGSDG